MAAPRGLKAIKISAAKAAFCRSDRKPVSLTPRLIAVQDDALMTNNCFKVFPAAL
jgi:hypothetical protein